MHVQIERHVELLVVQRELVRVAKGRRRRRRNKNESDKDMHVCMSVALEIKNCLLPHTPLARAHNAVYHIDLAEDKLCSLSHATHTHIPGVQGAVRQQHQREDQLQRRDVQLGVGVHLAELARL